MPVLLITGAGRGIGAATAKLAAGRGYDIGVNYKTAAKSAADVIAAVTAQGRKASLRFRPTWDRAGLNTEAGASRIFRDACLQRVITRVRAGGHDDFRPESADGVARSIELREWSKSLTGSAVAVRVIDPRQVNSSRRHIRCTEFEVSEIVIDPRGPAPYVTVA